MIAGPRVRIAAHFTYQKCIVVCTTVSHLYHLSFSRVSAHYLVPHVGLVVRTDVMCQAGRGRASDAARCDTVAWLCERAPLWVVVRVCALLREF